MSSATGRAASALRSEEDPKAALEFLPAGGEMGGLIREHDWAATPLGAPDTWSQSLRMMVSFLLANRFPLLLWWGPQYVQVYNDAYRPVLGAKHPGSLGQPCRECWAEIWHVLQPLIDTPFHGGPATWMEDLELEPHRRGFTEEAHFTIAYSPVPDDTAAHGIGGVLATVHEITDKVIGERRIAALRELGTRSAEAKTAEEACIAAVEMLARIPKDVPFALLYLIDRDGKSARLVAATGMSGAEAESPRLIRLEGDAVEEGVWPLATAVRNETIVTVEDLPARMRAVPPGPWSDPPNGAVVVPIQSNTTHHLAGLLVAGVSSRLRLDEQYRSFYELAAAQIATAVANARAYEEERRRAEALAEIDRAKTAFFSNVSHEFRTPLTLLLGPVAEAAANPATPPPVRSQLELAHRNALRLQKLVNSLLDFARIEAGRVQASYEPADLAVLTRDLASTFRSAMERAGLRFAVEIEDPGETVHVDREMWEKIVLNLLSNAFKFTLDGSVSVRLHRDGGGVVLEVADTGAGIPEHELPRIFDRFHRVEGTAGRTQEGSGIGLALVRELVRLHGGEVAVQSAPGRGTTFRVSVPFGTAHLPAERIKAARSLASTAIGARAFVEEALRWIPDEPQSGTSLQVLADETATSLMRRCEPCAGARILLADDNADMRAYVQGLLSPIYRVEAVADGAQALEAASRERPDLIVSDIMMPRLDGLALLQALRADESLRDVPVMLLSARAGEEARVEGLEAGADDFLLKPFSARELLARVGARLELVRARLGNYQALRKAHTELEQRTAELARFNHAAVGREMQIIELRGEVNALCERLGESPRYSLAPEGEPQPPAAACEPEEEGLVPLDAILRTAELQERSARPPDYATESRALARLAQALADSPRTILQTLADTALEVLQAGSAGLSLLTPDGQRFYWAAIAGQWSPHSGGGTPRGFGPCGDVLERDAPLLFTHWEHRYPYLASATPLAEEGLLVPFHVGGKSVGTIWVIAHDESRRFDAEDLRLLESLSRFAASAYQAVEHLGAVDERKAALNLLEDAVQARALAEDALRKLREREQQLRQSEEMLREADRRKDEFLALLGHELRNPIAPISMASELLSRTLASDTRARLAIDMIKRQSQQLSRLVDDLLDVGRITQGRIQLRCAPLDLTTVIAQAVETVEAQLRQKQHKVSILSSYEPLYVSGDLARLVQSVVNILSNAAKYTDPHGSIRLETRAEDSTAVIEIADNGSGIGAELLPRVFDLFVQSDRTLDRAQGGLGIGLAVVKRLIEMHGGEVIVRSAGLGCGTSFEIRLPRIARPEPKAADIALKSPPRRVLIVDDNADAAQALSLFLRYGGHDTRVALSSREALEVVESFRPEVGLLDIGLAEMSGYELAQRFRDIPGMSGIRLVAITGYGQVEDRQRALASGFDEHLVKPVDFSALERSLAGSGG